METLKKVVKDGATYLELLQLDSRQQQVEDDLILWAAPVG